MPMLTVNGTELYHELRGDGPAVRCIMGASGDGGHFTGLAELLADEFTVITYDRRGNGRSPRPAGRATTSPQQQADDAAALLDALRPAPAAVFGTSSGGTFALCMLVRHAQALRGAILHEPVLGRLYDDPEAVAAAGRELVRAGMEAGGPPEALKRFFVLVGGEANWNALDASVRERMLQTAETFLDIERGTFEAYLPTDQGLAAITAPVQILVSERGRAPQHEAARRLADRLGVPVGAHPGPTPPTWATHASSRRRSGRSSASSAASRRSGPDRRRAPAADHRRAGSAHRRHTRRE